MGAWVVTVAGIAILSVLCDVILPEGHTRKYIKTVFGVVVTFVIIQPLIGLISGGFDFSWSMSGGATNIQEGYVESVVARQNQIAANSVKSILDANNIEVENITVSELDGRVSLQLAVSYTTQFEAKVKEVVSKYFPNYEIVTVWA